jgi:hypothetical protein
MDFTPKIDVRLALHGTVLTLAAVGLIAWGSHVAPAPAPTALTHDSLALQESFQTSNGVMVMPAVELTTPGFRTARPEYYQPISFWYKSKNWWKRNAPIVGGAGGGALIGGLAGGGTGALIGGAVGAGGGYAYKRYHHHHHHYHNYHQ